MDEQKTNKSSLATAGLVLGIIGVVFSFIPIIRFVGYPMGVLSIVFGIIPLCGKKSVGKAVAALVLGVATLILTFVLQAVTIQAVDTAVNEISESSSDYLNDVSGENTEKLLKENVDVSIGKFTIEKGDFIDDYKLPVSVKNKGAEKSSFSIKIEAVDSNGNRLEEDTVYVDTLNPGQSQEFEAFTLVTSDSAQKLANATFKIVEVSKY